MKTGITRRACVLAIGLLFGAMPGVIAPAQADDDDRRRRQNREAQMEQGAQDADMEPRRRRRGNENGDQQFESGPYVPLEVIIARINAYAPGRAVGVQGPRTKGARAFYRILWETPDGRVIPIVVDARTGQIVGR